MTFLFVQTINTGKRCFNITCRPEVWVYLLSHPYSGTGKGAKSMSALKVQKLYISVLGL